MIEICRPLTNTRAVLICYVLRTFFLLWLTICYH